MTNALLFPGQGSQFIGMGKEAYDSFTEAKEAFQEVDDVLNQNLSQLIFSGSIEELTKTENTQPALMVTSVALFRVLLKQSNKNITELASYVAGHSLGEYSALVSAESLSLADAARLLRIRGNSMQEAVPTGKGGMAAIIGLSIDDVEEITNEISNKYNHEVQIANDNSPGQIVISGSTEAIAKAEEASKLKGAKKYVTLNVSAPFHSPLMKPATKIMQDAFEDVIFKTPLLPLIANVTAEITKDPDLIKKNLVDQVAGRVRWTETIQFLSSNEVTSTIEVGAGKVLSGLTKRIDRNIKPYSLQTPEDIDNFLENL